MDKDIKQGLENVSRGRPPGASKRYGVRVEFSGDPAIDALVREYSDRENVTVSDAYRYFIKLGLRSSQEFSKMK